MTSSTQSSEAKNESLNDWVLDSLCALEEFKEEEGLGGCNAFSDTKITTCWFSHPYNEDGVWEDTVILTEENIGGAVRSDAGDGAPLNTISLPQNQDNGTRDISDLPSVNGHVSPPDKEELVIFVDTAIPMDQDGDETLSDVLLDVLCDCACFVF